MSAYNLFIDSSTNISFDPEYDAKPLHIKNADIHRTPKGKRFVYQWANYHRWELPVAYVNSSFRFLVNTWWLSDASLLFTPDSFTTIYSVQITNNELPITEYVKPYNNLFNGVLVLEEY